VSEAEAVYAPLAINEPVPVALNDAEQLAVVALTVVKVHGEPPKLPAAVPVWVKATVPAGVEAVPTPALSLTKAVQLTDCAITAVAGEQVTAVVVARRATLTVLLVPLLVLWAVSDAATL